MGRVTNVAIAGAGFAGLAACWEFLRCGIAVTLFDPKGIGGGASGVSPGLLHPFTGKRARLAPHGREGMAAARHLLEVATGALGRPVFQQSGLLRLACNEQQCSDFQACALEHSEVKWWSAEQCQKVLPGSEAPDGIFIQSGVRVFSQDYLHGLWLACAAKGAQFVQSPLPKQRNFDLAILATGAAARSVVALEELKGQILELEWPSTIPQPKLPIVSPKHLVMHQNRCLLGATYERGFSSATPDRRVAKKLLLPQIEPIYPELMHAKVIGCYAGVRVASPSLPVHRSNPDRVCVHCSGSKQRTDGSTHHQYEKTIGRGQRDPTIAQIGKDTWVFTGFGSKGLLYSALFAKQLVAQVCAR